MQVYSFLSKDPKIGLDPGPKPKLTDFNLSEVIGVGNFGRVVKAYNKI